MCLVGLPLWLSGKESPASAGDVGPISGSGRSPGGGDGHPTPGFLPEEILMDRGAWRATVQGVAKRRTGLSDSATPSLYPLYQGLSVWDIQLEKTWRIM